MSDDRKKCGGFVVVPLLVECAPTPDCPVHGKAAKSSSSSVGYSREYADRYETIFGKKQVVGEA